MSTLANSEDSDEMPHKTGQKMVFMKEIQYYLEIITRDPLIYTMDHAKLIVSSHMEE